MLKIFSLRNKNTFKKRATLFTNVVLIVMLSVGFFIPTMTNAATLTSASDTMSNQTASGTSDHTFSWTSVSAYAAADTVTITSSTANNYTSAGSWATTDFELTMTGGTNGTSATNPVAVASSGPSCSAGAGHYTVTYTNSTSPSFVITLCSSFGTTGTNSVVTFKVKGATGTGTLTNKSTAVASTLWTITDSGGNTDSTTVAGVIVTNDVVTVTASVNPTLTFSLSSNTVALGTLTTGAAGTGTHTIAAATNGSGGFTVTYNGPTLTSGGNTIPVYSGGGSSPGTAGFGINLRDNATPNVGTDVVQTAGTCGYATGYGTPDAYKFVASTTSTITAVTGPADCTYTATYIANVSTVTPAGSYSTAITYIATGTF